MRRVGPSERDVEREDLVAIPRGGQFFRGSDFVDLDGVECIDGGSDAILGTEITGDAGGEHGGCRDGGVLVLGTDLVFGATVVPVYRC